MRSYKSAPGVISPEMESPKLLWLKEHLPASWKKAGHFFDLPDFLHLPGDRGHRAFTLLFGSASGPIWAINGRPEIWRDGAIRTGNRLDWATW